MDGLQKYVCCIEYGRKEMSNTTIPAAQAAMLNTIHKVEGFDPSVYAIDYTDLNTRRNQAICAITGSRFLVSPVLRSV